MQKRRKKVATAHICKIAWKTIPRSGWLVILLLTVGFYMLFPAAQAITRLYMEKNIAYELIGNTQYTSVDLEPLGKIDGIQAISPIIQFDTELYLEEKSVSCQVQAVYSSFLDPEMLEGSLFADTTNMPYLLLNEAAAKSFSESEDKSGIAVSTEVIMSRGGAETKCVICGIFRDGASTPKAYMSYDVASKLFSDEISGTELIFMTKNKGKAEAVVAGLLRNHISAEVDSNVMLAWELLEQQAWQTVLISTLLVVCATNAYLGSNHQDFQGCWIEKIILLTSGLTRREVFYVSLAKNSMTAGIAFCGAGMLAVVFGDFSWQGILCVACIGIAFCITCSVKYYMSSMEDRDGDT